MQHPISTLACEI